MVEKSPLAKVLVYQHVGFLLILALVWLDELKALPALLYGDRSFEFDFQNAALKILVVLAVWFLMIGSTRRILTRVRYLEGFMRVCSWCRHIDFKGNWISMEEFLERGLDTQTTHGICRTCLAKQAASLRKAQFTASSDTDPPDKFATVTSSTAATHHDSQRLGL